MPWPHAGELTCIHIYIHGNKFGAGLAVQDSGTSGATVCLSICLSVSSSLCKVARTDWILCRYVEWLLEFSGLVTLRANCLSALNLCFGFGFLNV